MKIGINLKIDVTKLDKARFFKGKSGTYCDLTAFIDTENVGQYGDNGTIAQSSSREERDGGLKLPICGNAKVFYKAESDQQQTNGSSAGTGGYYSQNGGNAPPPSEFDDVPF